MNKKSEENKEIDIKKNREKKEKKTNLFVGRVRGVKETDEKSDVIVFHT